MGTWGIGLSSNDTFMDIYGEFKELYNEGQGVKEVTSRLLLSHQDLVEDPEDSHNFWFAIAKSQWEYKSLDDEVYNRVKEIIEQKKDIEVWKQLGASDKELIKRDEVLIKFLRQISNEKERPKPRKKKKIRNPVFEKGTCLTFKLLNGKFGAALILEAVYGTPYGFNLVLVTDLNQKEKPTIKEILKSNVLKLNYASWDNEERISWFIANLYHKDSDKFEVIGKIEIGKTYDYKTDLFGASGDWFIWIIDVASYQFENGTKNWLGFAKKIKKYL